MVELQIAVRWICALIKWLPQKVTAEEIEKAFHLTMPKGRSLLASNFNVSDTGEIFIIFVPLLNRAAALICPHFSLTQVWLP